MGRDFIPPRREMMQNSDGSSVYDGAYFSPLSVCDSEFEVPREEVLTPSPTTSPFPTKISDPTATPTTITTPIMSLAPSSDSPPSFSSVTMSSQFYAIGALLLIRL